MTRVKGCFSRWTSAVVDVVQSVEVGKLSASDLSELFEVAVELAESFDNKDQVYKLEALTPVAEIVEPGYSLEEGQMAVLGNFNSPDSSSGGPQDVLGAISDMLDELKIEKLWDDEWASCAECGKYVRTTGDSYHWQPSFAVLHECEFVCAECLLAKEELLEDLIEECSFTPSMLARKDWKPGALNLHIAPQIDFEKFGYKKISGEHGYEIGYRGCNNDPRDIISKFAGSLDSFLFVISETEQFATYFDLFRKEEEVEDDDADFDDECTSTETEDSDAGGVGGAVEEVGCAGAERKSGAA